METKEKYGADDLDVACATEQEASSNGTQSTATWPYWLKESIQSFFSRGTSTTTSTTTSPSHESAKPQPKQTELKTVANSEWYVVQSFTEEKVEEVEEVDMSSAAAASLAAEGTNNNLTPTATRKRSQVGSTKGQSSTSVGPRTTSVSGKNPRVATTKQAASSGGSSSPHSSSSSSPRVSVSHTPAASSSTSSTSSSVRQSSSSHGNASPQTTTSARPNSSSQATSSVRPNSGNASPQTSTSARPNSSTTNLQTTSSTRNTPSSHGNTSPQTTSRPNSGNATSNARHNSGSHGNVSPQTTLNPRPNSGNATSSARHNSGSHGSTSPQTSTSARPNAITQTTTNTRLNNTSSHGNTSPQTSTSARPNSSSQTTTSARHNAISNGRSSPHPSSSSSHGNMSPHPSTSSHGNSSPHPSSSSSSASPIQRKPSAGSTRGSRQTTTTTLEVQNGGPSHRSPSPARIRSSSPSGRAAKTSSSKSNSSKRKMVLQEAGLSTRSSNSSNVASGGSSTRLDPPLGPGGSSAQTTTTDQSNGSLPQVVAAIAGRPNSRGTGSLNQNGAPSPSRSSSLKPNVSSSSSTANVMKSSMKQRKGILSNQSPSSSAMAPAGQSNTNSAAQTSGSLSSQGGAVPPVTSNGKDPSENGMKALDRDEGEEGGAFEKVRDTLRISRPKKKKKGKMAYSIVVDTDQLSALEINHSGADRYQDPFETSYAENGEIGSSMVKHDFKPASVGHNKQDYCDHCGEMAWSLYRQVLRCSKCSFIVHRKCESRIVIGCISKMEEGILQHDKQVEDVERIAAREEVEVNKEKKDKSEDVVNSGVPSSSEAPSVTPPSASALTPSRTSSSGGSATPPVSSAPTSSGYNETSPAPNAITAQYISEKGKLSRKIREYNRKTTPVHHIHIKSSHQGVDPNSIEYHGFVRVHMSVQRPIHVSTAITRTSWYRLMRPVKERTLNDDDGYDIHTAFYLPLDTNRLVHIQNKTTTKELVQILLKKFCVTDNPKKFSLYEEYSGDCRRLFEEDRPLEISLDASVSHRNSKLILRDNTYSTIQWDAFSAPELSNFIQILQREEELYLDRLKDRFDVWRKCIHQSLKDKCMEEQAKKTKKAVNSRMTPGVAKRSPKNSPKNSLKINGKVTKL